MRFTALIGITFLKNVRRTRLLSFITYICVFGIAIGVAALIAVQAVMDGMQNQMKTAILGSKAHIKITARDGGNLTNHSSLLQRVQNDPDITGATPVMEQEVMTACAGEMTGGILHGVDAASIGSVTLLPEQITDGALSSVHSPEACAATVSQWRIEHGYARPENIEENSTRRCIIIGQELARYFAVNIGDTIDIISPVGGGMGPTGPLPVNRSYTVGGIFHSGMYEYDLGYMYVSLNEAGNLFSRPDSVDAIKITVADMYAVEEVQARIQSNTAREDLDIRNWKTMNSSIFGALKMEKVVWFLIMGFVILVASFNIISMLTMLVIEKNREIAILRSIGVASGTIMRIFIIDGMIIGVIGTLLGVIGGVTICTILNGTELPFARDVYYMATVPVDMSLQTIILVTLASLLISFIATLHPARKAARINPAEGLRYE